MTTIFSTSIDGKSYEVRTPDKDPSNWIVIKQESLSYEKGDIILDKFREEYPQFNIVSYDELTKLCSRSKIFTDWLIKANAEYAEFAQLPLFLVDKVKPENYTKLQNKLTNISKEQSNFGKLKTALAIKYQEELRKLNEKEKQLIDKNLNEPIDDTDLKLNKILKVLSIDSTYLPFSLQMVIQRYVPSSLEDPQESGRVYAREILIRYKESLVDAVLNNPDLNVDELIKTNMLK